MNLDPGGDEAGDKSSGVLILQIISEETDLSGLAQRVSLGAPHYLLVRKTNQATGMSCQGGNA